MELVQRRKKLFNKDEFWKEFARKVDDLNSSPSSMQLSNNSTTKAATNYCNCSYTYNSDHNNYEPKLPLSNNYCPLFRLSSASNDARFKGDFIMLYFEMLFIYPILITLNNLL